MPGSDVPMLRSDRWRTIDALAVRGGANAVVRTERLELSHLAAPEPKSGASTNSATFA